MSNTKYWNRTWPDNVPREGDLLHRGDDVLVISACIGFTWPLSAAEPTFVVTVRQEFDEILLDRLGFDRVRPVGGQAKRGEGVVEWRVEAARS